jgi:RHS repeat-associated protein
MLSGSVSTFKRSDRSGIHCFSLPIARFEYNDLGHRVVKHSYHATTYQLTQSTFYLRDPSGRLLSVYQKTGTNPAYEKERYLYGMDMIGVMQMDASAQQPGNGEEQCEGCPPPPPPLSVGMGCTGQRMYYLKDQVGNVRVILLRGTTAGTPPLAFQNYYPFGMSHPGGLTGSFTQRFGYQGEYAEQDPETKLAAFEARMYDAVTGRWLAVDPQHQCHSPYLAMGNNPVMMVDPDGEFFGTLLTGIVDAVNTAFFKGGLDPTSSTARNNAWADFDPTAQGTRTNNAFMIDKGLFIADQDKNPWEKAWQITKRLTWQLPTTLAGNIYSHAVNNTGNVERVHYFHGATLVYKDRQPRGAMSMGGYINMSNRDRNGNLRRTDYSNALLLHEYGHYLQEQAFGYMTIGSGISSGISAFKSKNNIGSHDHGESWFEQDANARSAKYFGRKERFIRFEVRSDLTAKENFDFFFPEQRKSRRFWWYSNPITGIPFLVFSAFTSAKP